MWEVWFSSVSKPKVEKMVTWPRQFAWVKVLAIDNRILPHLSPQVIHPSSTLKTLIVGGKGTLETLMLHKSIQNWRKMTNIIYISWSKKTILYSHNNMTCKLQRNFHQNSNQQIYKSFMSITTIQTIYYVKTNTQVILTESVDLLPEPSLSSTGVVDRLSKFSMLWKLKRIFLKSLKMVTSLW